VSVERPPNPTEERKLAWRRACLAYREIREAGGSDQQAHEAAVEAVLGVLPTLTQKEASAEAVSAIAYATKYHSDWFWKGRSTQGSGERRTKDGGVGCGVEKGDGTCRTQSL
jgi:hypothetical protein